MPREIVNSNVRKRIIKEAGGEAGESKITL